MEKRNNWNEYLTLFETAPITTQFKLLNEINSYLHQPIELKTIELEVMKEKQKEEELKKTLVNLTMEEK